MKDAVRRLEAGETEGLGDTNPNEEVKEDNNQKKKKKQSSVVTLNTRLNNRVLDMRTPANQAIYRLSSATGMLFREYLYS